MKHFRLLILSLGLALVSLAAAARQVIVSGVVTDASGSALVGATVLVQGGSQGVTTDNKGQFTLNVPEGTVLDISFVGYEKQSVPVKAGAPMHITLQEEATQMGEVVVVGYGVQKKVNLTGAVSQISGDAIADKAAPNVLASLQGELPGVVVTQSSGQPGEEGFALQIRGHSSVNTISTLVLIDGIEGDLDMLNPNDIESISVLKDAFLLPFLAKRYKFSTYTAVAHSLASPCIVRTEIKYAKKKKFPHLNKCVCIAGPFNGVTYLGDIPNVNILNEKGRPNLMNPHYLYLLFRKRRFNPNIAFLNIYGNVLDNTNTDKFISVTSAKSIRYILAPNAHLYQEVEIRGKDAEHSWMHDNPFVIDIVNKFIGIKK